MSESGSVAKKSGPSKGAPANDRRAVAEQLRKSQASQEKRRSLLILGACVVVVLGLLAAAVIPYVKQRSADAKAQGSSLASIGVSASAAKCEPVKKEKATGNNQHLNPGTKIPYKDAPPSSGPHWGNFLQGSELRSLYTTKDRPEVERLVHSLEHGHTILWYDDTVKPGTDAYQTVKSIAAKFDAENDYFMAAPWEKTDGASFPSGTHVALTHWTGPQDQQGITQYCGAPSGAVLSTFMKAYPKGDAPEPGAP
ncbi:MAG: hypothetical protein JWR42_2849 [Marmoricola sp.]|nr:hypothetical protein [Marmoricola sp.]